MTEHSFTNAKGGSAIGVRVISRCATREIVGKNRDGSIEVRLTATSAGSQDANNELIQFLAEKLGVDPSKVEVVVGSGEREKILSIEGMTAQHVDELLFPA